MDKIHHGEPQHRALIDTLLPASRPPSPGFVLEAVRPRRPRRRDGSPLELASESTGGIAETQFARRGLRSVRGADTPLSTSMDGLDRPHAQRPPPEALQPQEPGAHEPAAATRAVAS